MRVLVFRGVLCLGTTLLFAQQGATLVGRVEQNGRPESSALVVLTSTRDGSVSYRTVANENGEFKFENVPPGSYSISSDGYEYARRAAGVRATLEITLR